MLVISHRQNCHDNADFFTTKICHVPFFVLDSSRQIPLKKFQWLPHGCQWIADQLATSKKLFWDLCHLSVIVKFSSHETVDEQLQGLCDKGFRASFAECSFLEFLQ